MSGNIKILMQIFLNLNYIFHWNYWIQAYILLNDAFSDIAKSIKFNNAWISLQIFHANIAKWWLLNHCGLFLLHCLYNKNALSHHEEKCKKEKKNTNKNCKRKKLCYAKLRIISSKFKKQKISLHSMSLHF